LIQSEHVRFEYISIQLDVGASAPQQPTKIKAFQKRLYQVYHCQLSLHPFDAFLFGVFHEDRIYHPIYLCLVLLLYIDK
jgi:hypothetical protein